MWIQGKSIRHLSATQVLVAQVVQAKVSRRAEPCRHDEKVLRFQNVRGKCQDQCEFAWCRTTGKNWRAWRRNVVHSLKCLNQHDNTGFAWSQPSLVQMQTCRPRSGCKWNPWICYSYSTSLFLEPTNVCSPGLRDGFESKKKQKIFVGTNEQRWATRQTCAQLNSFCGSCLNLIPTSCSAPWTDWSTECPAIPEGSQLWLLKTSSTPASKAA